MSDMMLITIKVTLDKLNQINADNEDVNFEVVEKETFTSIFKKEGESAYEVARIEHDDEEVILCNSNECEVLESIILSNLISPFTF